MNILLSLKTEDDETPDQMILCDNIAVSDSDGVNSGKQVEVTYAVTPDIRIAFLSSSTECKTGFIGDCIMFKGLAEDQHQERGKCTKKCTTVDEETNDDRSLPERNSKDLGEAIKQKVMSYMQAVNSGPPFIWQSLLEGKKR